MPDITVACRRSQMVLKIPEKKKGGKPPRKRGEKPYTGPTEEGKEGTGYRRGGELAQVSELPQ